MCDCAIGWQTKDFDSQISSFGIYKAAYLSNINISMRLRHRNFCAALLATVRASNSCACPAWLGIASSYAERLVTYRVSLLYPSPRKEICGANLHAPSRRSAV